MDMTVRFVVQLVENPNYFKKKPPMDQGKIWEHWDQAIPLLIAIGAIIVLLITYKIASKYIKKSFLSKILKKLRR